EPSEYIGRIAQVVGRDAFTPKVFRHCATCQRGQLDVIECGLGKIAGERNRPATVRVGRHSEAKTLHGVGNRVEVRGHGLSSGFGARRAARWYSASAARRSSSFTAACLNAFQ